MSDLIAYEIIFVDDASTDATLCDLRHLSQFFPKQVKYLSFSRNFGHQAALRAGLLEASGDCVITMDGDFQHPPEVLPLLLHEWQQGEAQVVNARRKESSQLKFFKRKTSTLFNKVLNALAEIKLERNVADFRLMDRCVVDEINALQEDDLFIRGMTAWLGFRHVFVEYDQPERFKGHSKYTLKKMFTLAISGITSFSIKPLRLALSLGCCFSFLAFLYAFYAIYVYFDGRALPGWTSVLFCVLFLGGVQLLSLGIIGEYLGRIHIQGKKRPFFVLKERSR